MLPSPQRRLLAMEESSEQYQEQEAGETQQQHGSSDDLSVLQAVVPIPPAMPPAVLLDDDHSSAIASEPAMDLQAQEQEMLCSGPPAPPVAPSASAPVKKKSKSGSKSSNVEITLEGKHLWDEFCRRGTEMIVNRAGRRMFPGYSVAISGLKPKTKYTMKLEVLLADNHRFKFLNARWLAVGAAEPQSLSETYVHPDSPNTGAFWMRHGVSFRKLKITNNKDKPGNNALLHSMHKYYLKLIVEEEVRAPPGEERPPPKTIVSKEFPETTFVAVTAYQNEEVTQLKISNNPFAKAFRESAAELDWETAQMLYGSPGMYSPSPLTHYGDHTVGTPGAWPPASWPMHSPLLPPSPLTPSLNHPMSPAVGLTGTSYGSPSYHHTAGGGMEVSSTHAHGFFQWPQFPLATAPPHRMLNTQDPYYDCSPTKHEQRGIGGDVGYQETSSVLAQLPPAGPSGSVSPSSAAAAANLPDFDSVFAPSLEHTHVTHSQDQPRSPPPS